MRKHLTSLLIVLISCSTLAAETPTTVQAPVSRPKGSDDINRESSSFIGDPDSIDPLPVKNESIKDDEEPVLEDIRDVLDAPKKPKPKKVVVKPEPPPPPPPPKPAPPEFVEDGPDLELERKFNQTFKKFNAEPTSEQVYGQKAAGREANTYTVQKGDTLWSISATLFGDPSFWPKIWSLNKDKIENPHFIYPGAQVLFYQGSGADAPALAVGPKVEGSAESGDESGSESEEKPSLTRLDRTEPEQIPDSIPIWRIQEFFAPKQEVEVQLKGYEPPPDNPVSNILLTDNKIKSDIELEQPELLKGRCGGEHLIHTKSLEGESDYVIYEPLEVLDLDGGDIHSYRTVGKAKVVKDKRLKITSCSSVMSVDLVYVPITRVPSLRSTRQSSSAMQTLLGGPNLGTQILFTPKQFAYIDLGTRGGEIGQTLKIKSQLTERQSGEVQIVDKFGSYAIGFITDVDDIVEKGDEIFGP